MIIIGHRGARGLAPENTLQAIQKVLELDVDMIEIDLRVTKDGVAILHHDPDVLDGGGSKIRISNHTFEELKKHKPDLTTLDAALDAADNKVRLLLEVKKGERVEPIVSVIRTHLAHDHNPKNLLVGSKSQKTLVALHKALPQLDTVVIQSWSGVEASWRARKLKTKLIAMRSWWLWPGFISAVHNSGYQLLAYTMNNPAKVKAWEKHGLYGVVTDYPDRFK